MSVLVSNSLIIPAVNVKIIAKTPTSMIRQLKNASYLMTTIAVKSIRTGIIRRRNATMSVNRIITLTIFQINVKFLHVLILRWELITLQITAIAPTSLSLTKQFRNAKKIVKSMEKSITQLLVNVIVLLDMPLTSNSEIALWFQHVRQIILFVLNARTVSTIMLKKNSVLNQSAHMGISLVMIRNSARNAQLDMSLMHRLQNAVR